MMNCRRVMRGSDAEKLAEIISTYAAEKKMTVSNIREVNEMVVENMNDNAILEEACPC